MERNSVPSSSSNLGSYSTLLSLFHSRCHMNREDRPGILVSRVCVEKPFLPWFFFCVCVCICFLPFPTTQVHVKLKNSWVRHKANRDAPCTEQMEQVEPLPESALCGQSVFRSKGSGCSSSGLSGRARILLYCLFHITHSLSSQRYQSENV